MTHKEKNREISTKYAVHMLRQFIHNNVKMKEMLEWLEEHDMPYERVVTTFYFANEQDKTLFALRFS